jgi:ERI1 exoribonuclease 2
MRPTLHPGTPTDALFASLSMLLGCNVVVFIVKAYCLQWILLVAAGLRWQGRQHSGLDDALNTARLAIKLMQQGVVLSVTQTSENKPVQQLEGSGGGSSKGRSGGNASSGDRQAAVAAVAAGGSLLCQCGVKAQKRTTKRPGPNHGRQFYSCGTWTITRQQSRGCGFFVWADELGGSQ